MSRVGTVGRWSATVLVIALAIGDGAAASDPTPVFVDETREVVFADAGYEFAVRPVAPVRYRTVSSLEEDIRRPVTLRSVAAYRLLRASPRQISEYVLCVTADGFLVVGEHRRAFDYGTQQFVFVRGEIHRGYAPLDDAGPWSWLLEVPLTRERRAVLRVQAQGQTWPIEAVAITAMTQP